MFTLFLEKNVFSDTFLSQYELFLLWNVNYQIGNKYFGTFYVCQSYSYFKSIKMSERRCHMSLLCLVWVFFLQELIKIFIFPFTLG